MIGDSRSGKLQPGLFQPSSIPATGFTGTIGAGQLILTGTVLTLTQTKNFIGSVTLGQLVLNGQVLTLTIGTSGSFAGAIVPGHLVLTGQQLQFGSFAGIMNPGQLTLTGKVLALAQGASGSGGTDWRGFLLAAMQRRKELATKQPTASPAEQIEQVREFIAEARANIEIKTAPVVTSLAPLATAMRTQQQKDKERAEAKELADFLIEMLREADEE